MSITCYLVRSAGKSILVDTGFGPWRRPGFPRGRLDEALKNWRRSRGHRYQLSTHISTSTTPAGTSSRMPKASQRFLPQCPLLRPEGGMGVLDAATLCGGRSAPAPRAVCRASSSTLGGSNSCTWSRPSTRTSCTSGLPAHTGPRGHHQFVGREGDHVGDVSHHPVDFDHPDWSPGFDADPLLIGEDADSAVRIRDSRWPHVDGGSLAIPGERPDSPRRR